MKIAFLNDTHRGVKNGSEVLSHNLNRFYDEVFFPYLLENKIDTVVHLGDYFDARRNVSYKTIAEDKAGFLDKLVEHGITMHIIPGNHDTYYRNTNEVCSIDQLLTSHPNVNVYMEPVILDFDGLKLGLVPWINTENQERMTKFIETASADMLGGHFDIMGFEMQPGMYSEHGFDREVFSKYEAVFSGHYHTKSLSGNIHYFGSQVEFYWSDAHDNKYFHVLDTKTREITPVRNPITLYQKYTYDDRDTDYSNYDVSAAAGKFVKIVVANKTDPFTFDRFVDRITNQGVLDLKITEDMSAYSGLNVDNEELSNIESTADLLGEYIESVDTDLDRGKLKGIMHELYVEAINMGDTE